jgi:hypothetical protein
LFENIYLHSLFIAAYPHRAGNVIKQGTIIQKKCKVEFSKIVPLDIEKCPYVILISKGIHSYPPPPPCHVPTNICTQLQELIH